MKYSTSKDILSSKIDDENILMSISEGFYFSLDPVGSRIWDLLTETPLTIDELADRLMEEYDVDRETCLVDVQSFIDNMASKKLIEEVQS